MGSFSCHRTHLIYYHQYVMLMFTVYFPVYLPRNQSDCYIKDLRLSGLMSTCRGKRPYNILSVCIACTYEYKNSTICLVFAYIYLQYKLMSPIFLGQLFYPRCEVSAQGGQQYPWGSVSIPRLHLCRQLLGLRQSRGCVSWFEGCVGRSLRCVKSMKVYESDIL